jgi:hypothetical protein
MAIPPMHRGAGQPLRTSGAISGDLRLWSTMTRETSIVAKPSTLHGGAAIARLRHGVSEGRDRKNVATSPDSRSSRWRSMD